jgi:hypothetical protein
LSVTDLDGDGWPDLLIRNGGGPDDFSDGGDRSRWLLRNTGSGSFEDVSASSGLLSLRLDEDPNTGRPGQVFTSGDVDNDGDLDIYVGQSRTDSSDSEAETSELMINDGTGHFSLGPEDSAARFANEVSNPAGVSFVDFDRDGNLDLWVAHNETSGPTALPDFLLRGDGEGGFVDVTDDMEMDTKPWNWLSTLNEAEAHSWSWSSVACDLNNDGNPELLASSYGRVPNHLWRADTEDGDLVYTNASIESGYAFDERTDWTDNLSAQCYCADHPDAEDCDQAPAPEDDSICDSLRAAFGDNYRWSHDYGREAFQLGGNSGTTVCADLDNDGWMDLMTHEIVHWDVGSSSDPSEILHNQGDPEVRFERPGNEATGLLREDEYEGWDRGDMTGAVFDFDNDGWLDIYIGSSDYPGNKGLLFHQVSPLVFETVPLDDYFTHYRSHGVAVADFDRDGDLDMVVGHSTHRCDGYPGDDCEDTNQVQFYENRMADGSNWVQLRLRGTGGSNAMAVGARVELTAGGFTQTRTVDGGHGHFGTQRDPVLHFGIGEACEAEVSVTWPDSDLSEESFSLEGNARYDLVQGEEALAWP